jgi:hypothetical protein
MLGLLLAALVSGRPAGASECTRADESRAYKSIDRLQSWKDIYAAYKRFKHCDDGAIAEGYSDGVARQMADHWNRLPKVLPLIQADPPFEDWLIGHLDETDANDDLMKIDQLSRTACPDHAQELCGNIHTHMKGFACPADFSASIGCQAKRGDDVKLP